MSEKEKILIVENLEVSYGSIEAVKNISFEIYKNEVVTILGANGAGKTTTLKAISGLIKIKKGSIRYKNFELVSSKAHNIVAMGISHAPEGRRIFGTLNVKENILLGAYTKQSIDKARLKWVYSLFPILKERQNQLAGTLSGGEQQMLAIARALMSKPEMLLLDEPSLGLAPILVKTIFNVIKEINNAGVTVLLVEQNARLALRLADRAYVLEVGKIAISGSSEELLSSHRVQEAYLGKKSNR